jgi:hypothetical protein
MCNHLNLKILIHIFTIIYLIMIIIVIRGENFVAHLDGLSGTPVVHHCPRWTEARKVVVDHTLEALDGNKQYCYTTWETTSDIKQVLVQQSQCYTSLGS